MLYITPAPISLTSYHIRGTIGRQPIVIRNVDEKVVRECLGTMGDITPQGMEDALFLLEWGEANSLPRDLEQSFGNTTYIVVNKLEEWGTLIKAKSWIERISIRPEMYRGVLESLRAIFTQDAYDYFWYELCLNKFNCSPYKWNMELMALLIRQASIKQRFSLEDLQNIYEMITPNLFESYIVNVGTTKGSQILHQMSLSELWALFIGNKARPPYLHRYYVVQNRDTFVYLGIVQLQLAFYAGVIDLKTGAIVLNSFWESEAKCTTSEKFNLKKLRGLLHLT